MDFVSPIISPIVQSLMIPVKKHSGFFFSSTNHVRNMRARLLELNDTKQVIERKMEANHANNLVIPNHVPRWLAEVETIGEEAGSIPTGGNGCFNLKMRYKAGKRSVRILKTIDDLENRESKMKWTNEQIPLGMVISSTIPSTSNPFHDGDGTQNIFRSRQLIFKDVLKALEPDSNTQKIALCGMGGVGKTTMMEELKKVVEKRKMFKWVLRVVIGKKSDPIAIQQAIAQYMGEPLTETTKEARVDRLGKRFEKMLENDTKILVILDDVWEVFDIKDIGLSSPLPNGCKFLLTTRDEKVCINMDIEVGSIFRLGGLQEAEASLLFWETVRRPSDEDSELHKIGEDILKTCGGLPMAIKTLALTLRGEQKDAWTCARARLQRHDLEDLYAVVDDIFEISYNNLRKDEDKAIFILCGLFPDDFDIALEELVRYGWGLRFFNKEYTLVEARQKTNTCISNLIHANLLVESRSKGHVNMHDLARAFVLSNISKFKQASIVNHGDKLEWPTEETRESCERMLLKCTGMYAFPQEFKYPNLTLLKLMDGDKLLKFPEELHKRTEKVQVIAYDMMRYVTLQCSTNLRTLCLRSCSLVENDISCLGDLISLEVLSVAYCGIRKLPSTIGNLKMLKLLDLTGCVDLCIDDGVLQNLEKLEELYMRVSQSSYIRFTNVNCDELERLSRKLYALEVEFFKNILQPWNVSFKNLIRFRISIGCALEETTNYTKKHTYLFKNTLKLVTHYNELLECKINELFSQTEELQLSVKDMISVEDILKPPSQHTTLGNLKVLHIFECTDLTQLFTIHVANGLKKLEILRVSSCPALKSLTSLCESVDVMKLPQLVELELSDLPNLTSIFPVNNLFTAQSLFNKKVAFPKLSKLKVHNVKKLKQIWAFDITSGEEENVSMLKYIELNGCDRLMNLFPRNPVRLLYHLEELKVARCCSIEVLFNIHFSNIEQHRSSSSLRRIRCENLQELREVWRIEEKNVGHRICGFQAVESIGIHKCKKFRNVFTPATANFDIGALTHIYISFDKGEEAESTAESKMEEISKDDENMSIAAYPSYHLTHIFHHLRTFHFGSFEGVKVMFEMDRSITNRDMETSQRQPLLILPRLECFELRNMDTLSHVWKCNNWKEFFIFHKHQQQSSFQNLTTIIVTQCKGIKYLFPPHMSKLLFSLKTILILFCDGMEEVVSTIDDGDDEDEVVTTSTTNLFSCLDYLQLNGPLNLKRIGGVVAKRKTNVIHDQFKFSQVGVVSWSLCQYFRAMDIWSCDALTSVIPSYAAQKMQKLQVLCVTDCKSMVEVFESEEINYSGCSSGNAEHGSMPLSRPMYHELPNLKELKISKCNLLEYVFTFFTLESLKKLEKLSISSCKAMKVIVREENEEESSKVVLPRLKSIELEDLPNLVGFFLGLNIKFQWPSLDYVMIKDCPQMTVFTSGESTAPKLKYIHTWVGKHNLECGLNFHQTPPPSSDSSSLCPSIAQGTPWSFYNLIEMDLTSSNKLIKIVPSTELPQLQILEKIHVGSCNNVEEVFELASEVTNNESQTVVKFPKLRELVLIYLSSLKYTWKSNKWRILEFPNLTRVAIYGCENLEHVFTASMVGTLTQLQELTIENCNHLDVIVKEEEECDGKLVTDIMLPCLKSLKLKNLPSLKGFCLGKENFTLPSMNTLDIIQCLGKRIFSEGRFVAPDLKLVTTSFGLFHVGEDLNSFILTKIQEGYIF